LAARALRSVRAPRGAGSVRRMCTAVAEPAEEAASAFSLKDPSVNGFVFCTVMTYLGAYRWIKKDDKMAAAAAAKAEATAAAKAEAEAANPPAEIEPAVVIAVTDVAPTSAPAVATSSPIVMAVAATGSSDPRQWKVADVANWLETIELPVHAKSFQEHAVDGKVLLTLTEQELYSVLNIISPLHRKKIAMAITDLRKKTF